MTSDKFPADYIALSAVAAAFVIVASLLSSRDNGDALFTDRLALGVSFTASCLFGVSLALRPGWLRRVTTRAGHGADVTSSRQGARSRCGHHPDCDHFRTHTLGIVGKTLCAGCTGLTFGSLASILLVSLYVALGPRTSLTVSWLLIVFGLALVAVNLAEIELPRRNGLVHLTLNALLVVGFLLVAVGLLNSTLSLVSGLVGVLVSFLWLDARVQLSHYRHRKMCKLCPEACKTY